MMKEVERNYAAKVEGGGAEAGGRAVRDEAKATQNRMETFRDKGCFPRVHPGKFLYSESRTVNKLFLCKCDVVLLSVGVSHARASSFGNVTFSRRFL